MSKEDYFASAHDTQTPVGVIKIELLDHKGGVLATHFDDVSPLPPHTQEGRTQAALWAINEEAARANGHASKDDIFKEFRTVMVNGVEFDRDALMRAFEGNAQPQIGHGVHSRPRDMDAARTRVKAALGLDA